MRVCVFCSTQLNNQNRSREHVIPQWLQAERGLTAEVLSSGFGIGETVNVKRQMPMDSFLAGQVCKECNTGWMSGLETQARGLLIRVLDYTAAYQTLDSDEKILLSKWAIKTAIACNSVIPEGISISRRFIRQFDKSRSDNLGRCGVFAGRLNLPNRFGYVQTTQSNPFVLTKEPFSVSGGQAREASARRWPFAHG